MYSVSSWRNRERNFGLTNSNEHAAGKMTLHRRMCGTRADKVSKMRRRELFKLIGGAVVAWPLAGRAQPPNMPVVGFLNDGIAQHDYDLAASFRQGLREAGFDAGQNVAIVERWADGQYGRLSDLTADLIDRKVSVIAAAFIQASLSARAGAGTTPVVFVTGSDPVRYGLVSSLNKPGGFTTGITTFNNVMGGKRLGLLRDLVPGLRTFAVLINPKQPEGQESYLEDLQSAARALGMSLIALPASTDGDIDEAFAAMVNQKIGALLVMPILS